MSKNKKALKIAIVGGGAGGVFAAIQCAEKAQQNNVKVHIVIYEASSKLLKKVRISGGGRCNVTHHQFDPKLLVQNYPRGYKELLASFHKFQPQDMVKWFEQRGVRIKHEDDGRMFPVTDSSETIINCFLQQCKKLGVLIETQKPVKKINQNLQLTFADGSAESFDKVLIATGSSKTGYDLAKQLGHSITELAPSLFTFKIKSDLLKDLAGISFSNTSLSLKTDEKNSFKQTGPLLITHWGLSGPALLKISAWAARAMKKSNYKAQLYVNWLNYKDLSHVKELLQNQKQKHPKAQIGNTPVEGLPKRFWQQLVLYSEIDPSSVWNEISKKSFNKLTQNLFMTEFEVAGISRFKEEFVECGGVNLKEIDFKSMQSKLVPGLYFSGEILDIDGVTGGFNFQNAWTGSWIAAQDMVSV